MGYLPKTQSQSVRPMHLRGMERCINKLGMSDIDEIARACAMVDGKQVEGALTSQLKMQLGKNKKKTTKDQKPLKED